MNKGRKITVWFLIIALIGTIAYDVWINEAFGVDATISRVVLGWSTVSPLFKALFIFGIGFLMGHLLWAQHPKCPHCNQ